MAEKKRFKKRYWFVIAFAVFLIWFIMTPVEDSDQVADPEDEAISDVAAEIESEPVEDIVIEPITEDLVREIIEQSALSEGDELTSLEVDGYVINAVVKVTKNELLTEAMKAEVTYSRMSDQLLDIEGWEVLTVEFVDVGTVSFERRESVKNEFGGEYFPLEEIINQLK